jgi:uncharacterized protein (TIGR03067 family)
LLMRTFRRLLFTLFLAVWAGRPTDGADPANKPAEKERLLGTWVQVDYESAGKHAHFGEHYFRFTGTKAEEWHSPNDPSRVRNWGYEIDEAADPKHLDLSDPEAGPISGYVSGIYKWEGEKLIWIWDMSDKPGYTDPKTKKEYTHRPESFTTNPGDGLERNVYARVTDPRLAAPPAERQAPQKSLRNNGDR